MIGLRRGILHEINNQMETIASVTKWQGRAMTPEEIPGIVHEAFRQLQTGRPAPGRDRDSAGRPGRDWRSHAASSRASTSGPLPTLT